MVSVSRIATLETMKPQSQYFKLLSDKMTKIIVHFSGSSLDANQQVEEGGSNTPGVEAGMFMVWVYYFLRKQGHNCLSV